MGSWKGEDGKLEGGGWEAGRGRMGSWKGEDGKLEGGEWEAGRGGWEAGRGRMGSWKGEDGKLEGGGCEAGRERWEAGRGRMGRWKGRMGRWKGRMGRWKGRMGSWKGENGNGKVFETMFGSRLDNPAGYPPAAEKDRLETFPTQRKPLPLYPPIRTLHVCFVSVHARVFTITADSNAPCYWLSTNGFVTE